MKYTKYGGVLKVYSGRTPHGVRGLKFCGNGVVFAVGPVAPHTGCVD